MAKKPDQIPLPLSAEEISKLHHDLTQAILQLQMLEDEKRKEMKRWAEAITAKRTEAIQIAESLKEQEGIDTDIEGLLAKIQAERDASPSHLPELPPEPKSYLASHEVERQSEPDDAVDAAKDDEVDEPETDDSDE